VAGQASSGSLPPAIRAAGLRGERTAGGLLDDRSSGVTLFRQLLREAVVYGYQAPCGGLAPQLSHDVPDDLVERHSSVQAVALLGFPGGLYLRRLGDGAGSACCL
jgi:hypothetical protein